MNYINKFIFSNNFLNRILIVLISLIIITYPSGPFLPDLFLVISVLIFFFVLIKKKLTKYVFNHYTLFFFIFYLYIIINSFFAILPKVSLISSGFYFRFYLFSMVIWYLLDEEKKFKKIIFWVLLAIVLFVNIDTIWQYFNTKDLFGFESQQHRLSGPFDEELIVGSYLSKMVPLLIALNYLNKFKNYILISGILIL